MNFKLEIIPAIHVEKRHKIEDLLRKEGYEIHGGGTNTDGSACDISFSDKEENLR